jgi:cytochrome c biogenesis protein
MTQQQYTVYGVPGQIKRIGDTECFLSIDDFRVEKREDGSVAQYTTDITVQNVASAGASGGSASISVNHPATLCGMKFYQNATGWAAQVDVYKDGKPLQQEVVCAGDYLSVKDKEGLVVLLNAFYPDYVMTPGVGPSTASDQLNNPAYLYSVYYQGQIIGMNALMAGEEVTIDAYTVTFTNPQSYTLIQVKVDRFTPLALAGGLVTMLGLLLALYLQPARVWAIRQDDGLWTVYGQSRKGGALFRERFEKAADQRSQNHASD